MAEVNGRPILTAELTGRAGAIGGGKARNKRVRELLDQLIDQELLAEEAERRGWGSNRDVKRAARERSVAKLQAAVMKGAEALAVDDGALKARYEAQSEEFYRPGQVEVASVAFDEEEAARSFVVAAGRQIKANHFDYRDLFQRIAKAQEAVARLPTWVSSPQDGGQLPKLHWDAIFALKRVGALTAPLKTDGAWIVFQRTGRRDRRLIPFDQARRRLRADVRRERRTGALDALVAQASARLKIQTFGELLNKVEIAGR